MQGSAKKFDSTHKHNRKKKLSKATFFEWLNTAIKSNDRITLFDDFLKVQ